jgi:hypothetical protein
VTVAPGSGSTALLKVTTAPRVKPAVPRRRLRPGLRDTRVQRAAGSSAPP